MIASAVEEQTATTNEIARNVTEAAQGDGEHRAQHHRRRRAARESASGATRSQQAAGGAEPDGVRAADAGEPVRPQGRERARRQAYRGGAREISWGSRVA